MQIEFFFDFSCPYAYLGYTQIEALAERQEAKLIWKPMLLGGIFRAVDTPMNMAKSQPMAKTRHNGADMQRWARMWKVPLKMPSAHPMRSVRALRALLATPAEHWSALIGSLYRAYWVEGMPFDKEETIAWAAREAGLGEVATATALAANGDESIKGQLRERTQEAINRDVFGAPTLFVSGPGIEEPLMFWGQDRLEMCEAVLMGWRPGTEQAPPRPASPAAPRQEREAEKTIDFWYDFSSPYAYLGSTQIEALAKRQGAQVRWRPLLLGALFKAVGTPNVPLMAMSDAKRRYQGRELQYWSSYWQVPFAFSPHFPLRTVTALRLALLAGPRIGALSAILFRAAWVDGLDIGSDAVLQELLSGNDFDAEAMLAQCSEAATKDLLRANTEEAMALGVFGVPTCALAGQDGGNELFWGQDRFGLLAHALR